MPFQKGQKWKYEYENESGVAILLRRCRVPGYPGNSNWWCKTEGEADEYMLGERHLKELIKGE